MLLRDVWEKFTDVSEVLAISIIWVIPDNRGSKHL
jgi:hypothetical protein